MGKLKTILSKKIDVIEDDQDFMIAEHNAILEYCSDKNFILSDSDMRTIIERGHKGFFEDWKDRFEGTWG